MKMGIYREDIAEFYLISHLNKQETFIVASLDNPQNVSAYKMTWDEFEEFLSRHLEYMPASKRELIAHLQGRLLNEKKGL